MNHPSSALTDHLAPMSNGSPRSHHQVQFYEDEAHLAQSVFTFLRPALQTNHRCLLFVTESHRDAILGALRQGGVDVRAALDHDLLAIFDARQFLSGFMVGLLPDWERFESMVGRLLEVKSDAKALDRVHVYGEMVDLLWQEGNQTAALALEAMWNELGKRRTFSLLCGYALANPFRVRDLTQVCDFHGGVLPLPLTDGRGERGTDTELPARIARSFVEQAVQRKRVEAALSRRENELDQQARDAAHSEQELIDFIDNAAVPIRCMDAEGVIRWANQAELRLLGYSRSEYVGRHIARFHADQSAVDDILSRLSRNETLDDYEARLRTKNGSIKHVLISSNVYWRDGKFIHTRCFTRDITEQKRIEEALKQSEAVAKAARREAEMANRAKDEFLAVLGHELRNPLMPIFTALELLRARDQDQVVPEHAVISRQARLLARLVDDLMDISRITRGHIELDRRVVELSTVVEKSLEMARPLFDQRRQSLEVWVPASGLTVDGDEHRLAQIVTNLLVNAAKYSGAETSVRLQAERAGAEVVLSVIDQGVGITPDLLPKIFDVFVQGARPLKEGGLGLGLAIVNNLAFLHGGRVTAHSAGPGTGSEFRVYLPYAKPATEPVMLPEGAQASLPEMRILVVDDNEDGAALLADALRLTGHEACTAHDGPTALDLAREFRPSVALVDIGLPAMDGFEVARRFRATKGLEHVPLIAMTGFGRPSDRARALEAGFAYHLVKPIELSKLQATLAQVLGSK